MTTKRYVIQKLVFKDNVTKVETWINTSIRSNNPDDLIDFITKLYRIFDTIDNFVVRKRRK
ncbi:hypothetical protein B9T62_19010 [Paenibacillus donghaensis]|uniref:Uncharacterized protein n=1 Tax=Paenibacillus donghaensis TaxID=414771 RepID=A0A2Z2KB05_9BACL|nr:hypothetical protein B9T62_19010 [Paenibacillus donghaensis]